MSVLWSTAPSPPVQRSLPPRRGRVAAADRATVRNRTPETFGRMRSSRLRDVVAPTPRATAGCHAAAPSAGGEARRATLRWSTEVSRLPRSRDHRELSADHLPMKRYVTSVTLDQDRRGCGERRAGRARVAKRSPRPRFAGGRQRQAGSSLAGGRWTRCTPRRARG